LAILPLEFLVNSSLETQSSIGIATSVPMNNARKGRTMADLLYILAKPGVRGFWTRLSQADPEELDGLVKNLISRLHDLQAKPPTPVTIVPLDDPAIAGRPAYLVIIKLTDKERCYAALPSERNTADDVFPGLDTTATFLTGRTMTVGVSGQP